MKKLKPYLNTKHVPRILIFLNLVALTFYFSWWVLFAPPNNPILFGLLLIGELYHILMTFLFLITIRNMKRSTSPQPDLTTLYRPTIDVFVTVAGEPVEIVKHTLQKIKKTKYPKSKLHIHLLNDSYVAGKSNWDEYEKLAQQLGVNCITRTIPGGAKAGNINHALGKTEAELVTIFDADMAPERDFFTQTVAYFQEEEVGFVQTPQYYANHQKNNITQSAWEQQEFFFGPIMRGKNYSNAAFICGTNVVMRRTALLQAGGMNEDSIAEDFLTSFFIHQQGWKSVYVPEVLAYGLAPEDLLSYHNQQFRWARGSLEILFHHNPLFTKGLSWAQRLEYLSSSLFYANGVIILIDALIPLLFLFFGWSPISATTTIFAIFFLPFISLILYTLHLVSDKSLTLRAISFTHSSWVLQVTAVISTLLKKKMGFKVTAKQAQSGNYLSLAYPHLIYIGLVILAGLVALSREGISPSVVTNLSWAAFNSILFMPFIYAAIPWEKLKNRWWGWSQSKSTPPATKPVYYD